MAETTASNLSYTVSHVAMHHCKSGQHNGLCACTWSSDGLFKHKKGMEIHPVLINSSSWLKHFDIQTIQTIFDMFIVNLIDDAEEIFLGEKLRLLVFAVWWFAGQ